MAERLSRQQIYDRIRSTSKDSYILEEMKRLGFWDNSEVPSPSEILIQKEAEIKQELDQLVAQDRKYKDKAALLQEMRKARMNKAKENRIITKQKNIQKKLEKAARWKLLQLEQVIYLGKGVSEGLNNTECNIDCLQKYNLPQFSSLKELAGQMGTDLASLRYLLYNREVAKISHYYTFEIPKKTGGKRKISAPKQKLKKLQQWILEAILNKLPASENIHGFIKQRSIITNAQPHIGKDIVINMDLKDFFPGISYKRVKGLFSKLGYSEQMSIIFALICTQPETDKVEMDGVLYYVQNNNRFLPQGSPASPAISNLIAYKLDKRIEGLARKYGFTYTRYADDLTFSSTKENEKNIACFLHYLKEIIKSEGFTVHPDKTQVMRKGGLQKVTGIVVNEKQNIERKQLRKFRALLHNIDVNGWQNQKWGQCDNLPRAIEGYINFIRMVNPDKGKKFEEQLLKIVYKHGYPVEEIETPSNMPPPPPPLSSPPPIPGKKEEIQKENKTSGPEPDSSQENWWNIFS